MADNKILGCSPLFIILCAAIIGAYYFVVPENEDKKLITVEKKQPTKEEIAKKEEEKKKKEEEKANAAKLEEIKEQCRNNYKKCRFNAELVNYNRGAHDAQLSCKKLTESIVKYGKPDWAFASYFDGFNAGIDYVETGKITLIDNQVKIQNGFGAWQNSSVVCEYDLNTNNILSININGHQYKPTR